MFRVEVVFRVMVMFPMSMKWRGMSRIISVYEANSCQLFIIIIMLTKSERNPALLHVHNSYMQPFL